MAAAEPDGRSGALASVAMRPAEVVAALASLAAEPAEVVAALAALAAEPAEGAEAPASLAAALDAVAVVVVPPGVAQLAEFEASAGPAVPV